MTSKDAAIKTIERLTAEGFDALLAGGCVRDMLLGREAKDYDIATSARPDDIIRLFRRTIKVGAKFGVVIVLIGSHQIEVATFRTESGYADGRHPDTVEFSDARADASRRDFTVNGMFYDPVADKIIDYVDGQADLKKKIIRTIGDPQHRFDEDYLRMLRAIRFSTQLDFSIEDSTWDAVCQYADNITKISAERISAELEAMLKCCSRGTGGLLFIESGLADAIFAGLDPEKVQFGLEVIKHLPEQADFPLAMAAFFAGYQTDLAVAYCQSLKLSNAWNKHLVYLLANRGKLLEAKMPLARFRMLLAGQHYRDLYDFQKALLIAHGKSYQVLETIDKRAESLEGIELTPPPLLNGHELMSLGVKPGPMVGRASQQMYHAQLNEELKTPAQAKNWVISWLKEHDQPS